MSSSPRKVKCLCLPCNIKLLSTYADFACEHVAQLMIVPRNAVIRIILPYNMLSVPLFPNRQQYLRRTELGAGGRPSRAASRSARGARSIKAPRQFDEVIGYNFLAGNREGLTQFVTLTNLFCRWYSFSSDLESSFLHRLLVGKTIEELMYMMSDVWPR